MPPDAHHQHDDANGSQPQGLSAAHRLTDPYREVRLKDVQLRASICEDCGHALDGLALHNAQVRCPECGGVFHAALTLKEFSKRNRASRNLSRHTIIIWTTLLVFVLLIAGQFGQTPFLASLAIAGFIIASLLRHYIKA